MKIVLDIEVSPHLVYTYGMYEENAAKLIEPQFILSFQYKELGSKKVHVVALPDFKDHYRKKPHSDELVVKELWKVLDNSEIVIGHNIRAFDMKKINARFAYWGLTAPSHYQLIDTLTLARGQFSFPQNSLSALATYLNVPQGKLHFGIEQWVACINGDMGAWKKEREYGARDIEVTEEIYNRLRSFMPNHPHMYPDEWETVCHTCGSDNLIQKGFRVLKTGGKRKRYMCKDCGTYSCERKSINVTTTSA